MSWVMFADVWAEKVMVKGDTEASTHLIQHNARRAGQDKMQGVSSTKGIDWMENKAWTLYITEACEKTKCRV